MNSIVNMLIGHIIRASNNIRYLRESRVAESPITRPGTKKPTPTPSILTTDSTDVAAGR